MDDGNVWTAKPQKACREKFTKDDELWSGAYQSSNGPLTNTTTCNVYL